MAEEQKPIEVAQEVAQETPVVAETPVIVDAAVVEDKPAEEVAPVEAAVETEAAKEEAVVEEAKPIEEGHLGYKSQGLSFPKNLIASKEFFFFGTEAVQTEALAAYKKAEKASEHAFHNIAWASHTGKGLLFFGDKKAPNVINLADAAEPEVDGSNKFTFTAKGNKHSFKAANVAERDGWVAQLKSKIAEAKELAASVTETETYKNTLEALKPAPVVVAAKEEAPKEEAAPVEEAAATEEAAPVEEAKDEAKAEEPAKRRSASRKRASFFGFGKKEIAKEEAKVEEPTEEVAADVAEPTEVAEVPVVEEPVVTDAAVVAPVEEKAAEEATPSESPKEKPTASKRNSFFGGVFSKKEKKAADATEAPKEDGEVAAETAPVIPPVEATTPLAVDVASAEPAAVEAVEPTNGEVKNVKEKRKSSLPFAFGKREKSPAPADGEKAAKGQSAFSKIRSTIKGKKAEEKTAEEATKEEAVVEAGEAAAAEEAVVEAPVVEEVAPVVEAEAQPEVVAAVPVVTAAA